MTAFVANTNSLDLLGLKSHIEGTYINDATVTFTIKTKAGASISGVSWPQAMVHVVGSNGDYRGILPADLPLANKGKYIAFIDAQGGGERIGHWEFPFTPLTRTGIPEDEATLN